jgi:hypothetical protein
MKTKRLQFDIYGNSPLIKHYLVNGARCKLDRKAIFVHRTEVQRDATQTTSSSDKTNSGLTFRDVLSASAVQSRKQAKQYQTVIAELSKDRYRIVSELNQTLKRLDSMASKILSKPTEVREVCDQICDSYLKKVRNAHETSKW